MNRIARESRVRFDFSFLLPFIFLRSFFVYRYHIVELSLHEGSDERENLVHEPGRVQHVNGLEPDRHALLKILEESPDTVYRQPRQVTETAALHVEEKHISWRAAVRVEARVDGHQQQLDAVIEHVLERSGVRQAMKNYPRAVSIRLG